jgi:CRISPR-associated protein Cst2
LLKGADAESRAVVIGALLRIDVGNPNAGWPEGTITVIKKVERPDRKASHPYISGQAIRRYLRDTLDDLIKGDKTIPEKMSPLEKSDDPKAPVVTRGDPEEYVDDDLFGFMRAVKGETKKRESPLRVSPAFGLFPYAGDRDLGTRSAVEYEKEAEAGGAIFETEVTNNVFRTTLLLELDRIGRWQKFENVKGSDGQLQPDARKRRASLLVHSLKYLWGGGRRTRILVDLTPQFVICAKLTRKTPIFLHAINVRMEEGKYYLETEILKEVLRDYENDIQSLYVGVRKGFLSNETELQTLTVKGQKVELLSAGDAIEKLADDLSKADMP